MTGILSRIYLYKGSEVDNYQANLLIDIYEKENLLLINTELS